jgi:hypothetical protein
MSAGFAGHHEQTDLRTLDILDNIRVASPCPASWEKMSGDDRVRHCQLCQLNVYNLSEMTRAEAERLIISREGRLCVRFYRRADGTILTRDCPRGWRALTARVSRVAGAVLTALMAVTPVFSQSQSAPASPTQAGDKQAQSALDVTVLDPTDAVIQNAKVIVCRCIKNEKEKDASYASTDASGVARFQGLPVGTYEITVQARGFKVSRQTITVTKPGQIQVQAKLKIGSETSTIEVKAANLGVVGEIMMGDPATIRDSWLLDLPLR